MRRSAAPVAPTEELFVSVYREAAAGREQAAGRTEGPARDSAGKVAREIADVMHREFVGCHGRKYPVQRVGFELRSARRKLLRSSCRGSLAKPRSGETNAEIRDSRAEGTVLEKLGPENSNRSRKTKPHWGSGGGNSRESCYCRSRGGSCRSPPVALTAGESADRTRLEAAAPAVATSSSSGQSRVRLCCFIVSEPKEQG